MWKKEIEWLEKEWVLFNLFYREKEMSWFEGYKVFLWDFENLELNACHVLVEMRDLMMDDD